MVVPDLINSLDIRLKITYSVHIINSWNSFIPGFTFIIATMDQLLAELGNMEKWATLDHNLENIVEKPLEDPFDNNTLEEYLDQLNKSDKVQLPVGAYDSSAHHHHHQHDQQHQQLL